jgi:hypothetical protein
MPHQLKYDEGTDARNHTVKCSCGWGFAGTYKAVRERGPIHCAIFRNEQRAWNDPERQMMMPLVQHQS